MHLQYGALYYDITSEVKTKTSKNAPADVFLKYTAFMDYSQQPYLSFVCFWEIDISMTITLALLKMGY